MVTQLVGPTQEDVAVKYDTVMRQRRPRRHLAAADPRAPAISSKVHTCGLWFSSSTASHSHHRLVAHECGPRLCHEQACPEGLQVAVAAVALPRFRMQLWLKCRGRFAP